MYVVVLQQFWSFIFFSTNPNWENCGYGVAGGCFTDVMLHSSDNYHQEHAAEPPKAVVAAWGAVMLHFHTVPVSTSSHLCAGGWQRKRRKKWPVGDHDNAITSLYVSRRRSVKLHITSYYCRWKFALQKVLTLRLFANGWLRVLKMYFYSAWCLHNTWPYYWMFMLFPVNPLNTKRRLISTYKLVPFDVRGNVIE